MCAKQRYVPGCNYHTTWQKESGMRFVLAKLDWSRGMAQLRTRVSGRLFWTKIDDLIFIQSAYNIKKANMLEHLHRVKIKDFLKEFE